jgi:hypothetical protein
MKSPAPKPVLPDPIEVGSFFLETLTTGMYEDPFHCIREYVQNGLDAIQDAVAKDQLRAEDGEITVTIITGAKGPSLTVRDNGTGIPLDRAYSTLVSLGASRKTPTKHAGFRGIGRLAGIAYCKTLRFKTKAAGEAKATIVEWDCGRVRSYFAPGADPVDVRAVVKSSVKTWQVDEAVAEHYTEVEMSRLAHLGEEFVEIEKLQPYLRQVCPVDYPNDFDHAEQVRNLASGYGDKAPVVRVTLQQKRERLPIYKPYKAAYPTSRRNSISKVTHLETFSRKDHGWYGWFGVSNFPGEIVDDSAAGVRFRVKNIQVGDAGIIMDLAEQLTAAGSERRLMRWAVGEIFVTSTEVVPNARRDGFEDSAAWRAIQKDVKEQVAKLIIKQIRGASSLRSAMNAFATVAERLEGQIARDAITSAEKAAIGQEIARQLTSLAGVESRHPGADPKEVIALTSRFKDLTDKLSRARVVDPPPPEPEPESEPQGGEAGGDDEGGDEGDVEGEEDAADAGGDDNGDDADAEEDDDGAGGQPTCLDLVAQVLTEELGQARADQLMVLIRARLAAKG